MPNVLACVALTALAGCGGRTTTASSSDAQIAAQIRASAKKRELERERRARAGDATRLARTTTVQDGESLPAGSAEIDGTSRSPAATQSAPPGRLLSAADGESFARLGATLQGQEGIAVSTLGIDPTVSRTGALRSGVAWSTGKTPVAMAAIVAGVGTQTDLTQAITASDNTAAERLWTALGGGARAAAAATAQLRASGDRRTIIEARRLRNGYTAFGQTNWLLTDQARFTAGMACTNAGAQVLGLMNEVVAGQRWGLGSTGNEAQFKGGWGPGLTPGNGDGWLDRQMGVLTIKGRPIAVAIATTARDHATGTRDLTTIARWVASHVDVEHAPRRPAC